MTTGRINQVTILSQRQRRRHPRGGGVEHYRLAWPRRSAASRPRRPARARQRQTTDSIAPTEFPRAWSVAREIGPMGRHTSPLARPEWRRPATCHALWQAVTDRGLPPRIWERTVAWANHPQTPIGACCGKRNRASVPRPKPRCSPLQSGPLQHMGATPPAQGKKSKPAPDGVLNRVNVAGRHLGHKLCC